MAYDTIHRHSLYHDIIFVLTYQPDITEQELIDLETTIKWMTKWLYVLNTEQLPEIMEAIDIRRKKNKKGILKVEPPC